MPPTAPMDQHWNVQELTGRVRPELLWDLSQYRTMTRDSIARLASSIHEDEVNARDCCLVSGESSTASLDLHLAY